MSAAVGTHSAAPVPGAPLPQVHTTTRTRHVGPRGANSPLDDRAADSPALVRGPAGSRARRHSRAPAACAASRTPSPPRRQHGRARMALASRSTWPRLGARRGAPSGRARWGASGLADDSKASAATLASRATYTAPASAPASGYSLGKAGNRAAECTQRHSSTPAARAPARASACHSTAAQPGGTTIEKIPAAAPAPRATTHAQRGSACGRSPRLAPAPAAFPAPADEAPRPPRGSDDSPSRAARSRSRCVASATRRALAGSHRSRRASPSGAAATPSPALPMAGGSHWSASHSASAAASPSRRAHDASPSRRSRGSGAHSGWHAPWRIDASARTPPDGRAATPSAALSAAAAARPPHVELTSMRRAPRVASTTRSAPAALRPSASPTAAAAAGCAHTIAPPLAPPSPPLPRARPPQSVTATGAIAPRGYWPAA